MPISHIARALPYMISFLLVPVLWGAAMAGGWWLVLPFVLAWHAFSLMDAIMGLNTENPDPDTPESALFWYRLHLALWVPLQAVTLFGLLYFTAQSPHLSPLEMGVLFFGVGVVSGTVGIVYAHELIHQRPKWERALGDILLGMVCYGHFRSEHLLVHHRHVGTPRDAVTARYNEGFHRFFARVLPGCLRSAWAAEREMLARRGLGPWHRRNPFWRYGALALASLALAYVLAGPLGVALFLWQSLVAVWQLELTNYIEHYGLTRAHLGGGKYEHVKPRHSWNATHRASNWLLINLQRHSDHHYRPSRRFPLLQTYDEAEAPQLPYGYTVMGMVAMVPPAWRRMMNPRVRAWRKLHYPQITDWGPYTRGETELPT